MRSFGCKCFVLNNGKHLIGKFDAKNDEAILMGFALNSKAYNVFNKTSLIVEESIHIILNETNATLRKVIHYDDSNFEDSRVEESKNKKIEENEDEPSLEDLQRKKDQHDDLPKTWKAVRDHPLEQVIGDPIKDVRTRRA